MTRHLPVPERKPLSGVASAVRSTAPEKRMVIWAGCQGCGLNICLAIGYMVSTVTPKKRVELLRSLGWAVVPKMLCHNCHCPMSWEERLKMRELLSSARRASGKPGINFAKLNYDMFLGKMCDKYPQNRVDVLDYQRHLENTFKQ
jgi:hypothetical protein